jgi:hypothetical protein
MEDKEVQGEVMTNEYSSNRSGLNPTVTERDLGHYRSRVERRSAVRPVETALMSTTVGTIPLARRGQLSSAPAWVRIAARILAPSLDNKLAQGADPVTSEILSTRAQQLASLSVRHSLAAGYLDLIDAARAPLSPFSPVVPVVRRRVVESESLIRDIARALLGPIPRVRGIAMAVSLLSDGAGPIFHPASESDLSDSLQEVLAQIDPLESTTL